VSIKRVGASVIAGFFLVTLILPQVALAAGPEISDVDVVDISFASATITWITNTTSDSTVNYGTDRPKDVTWESTHDDDEVTHHSIHLEGLTPGETYYFEIQSTDGSGTANDNNDGEYYSFKTLAWYSISLSPNAGSCAGEEITVTATVAAPGTYYICWDSLTAVQETFQATEAGSHEAAFSLPGAVKGDHKVYLTDISHAQKGEYAIFTVNPSVQIEPDEGPVGTAVTISGCGFAASQDIQVEFKDTVISTTQTTSSGSWPTISYTIPDTPGGDYNFEVEVDEAVWASRGFEVTPEITVSSISGIVGHTIEVTGTGFQSNEKDIEVTFDGEAGKTNTPIVANPNGRWEATVVIPPISRGTHTIDASGKSTAAGDVPGVEFTVGAGISIDPISAYVGHTITVEGGGFAERETGIQVRFDGVVVTLSNIPVDSNGYWKSSFTVPASAYGSHTVLASGDITTSAATATFSTQSRILAVSPNSGAPGDLVSLTSDGFGSSEQLTMTIAGIDATGNMRTQPNGNVAVSFYVPARSPKGKQTLVVTDGSGASDSTDFTVTTKTLSTTPLPISPKSSTLRSGEVSFRWLGVTNSTGYTYTLEIGENANSGSIWSKAGIEETSYKLTDTETVTETLPKGNYYWRVKMVDDYGNESAWSESIEFGVSPIPIWVWVIVGVVVLIVLMVVAYRETKFKVTE
jgi:hypothetical protein